MWTVNQVEPTGFVLNERLLPEPASDSIEAAFADHAVLTIADQRAARREINDDI